MSAQHTPAWQPVYVKPEGATAHHWRCINAQGEYLKRADGRVWVSTTKASAQRAITKATGGAA